MKSSLGILISASLLVISVHGDMMDIIENGGAQCLAETGADLSKIMKLMQGQDVEMDDNIKCFTACMMKAFGVMSDDGVISTDAALGHVPADIKRYDEVIAAVESCFHGEGSDHCETAGEVLTCLASGHLGLVEVFM